MRLIGAVGILVALTGAVEAQPLKVQQQKVREEAGLAVEVVTLNKTCETQITATFNWETVPEDRTDRASNFCNHALDGIERVCVDSLGKEAVRKQITEIKCSYAEQRSMSLSDGIFEFKSDFDYNTRDTRFIIFEYLQGKL
jgi:hypothetical protein